MQSNRPACSCQNCLSGIGILVFWRYQRTDKGLRKDKVKKSVEAKKYRIPDNIPSPKEELYKLIPDHQQIEGAKRIAPHMDIKNNTSVSFQVFVTGIQRLIEK